MNPQFPTMKEAYANAKHWENLLRKAWRNRHGSKSALRWARHCASQYRQWCQLV